MVENVLDDQIIRPLARAGLTDAYATIRFAAGRAVGCPRIEKHDDPPARPPSVRLQSQQQLFLIIWIIQPKIGHLPDKIMSVYQYRHIRIIAQR
jgi:hypothetical protein